jgi:hypothetical protein
MEEGEEGGGRERKREREGKEEGKWEVEEKSEVKRSKLNLIEVC